MVGASGLEKHHVSDPSEGCCLPGGGGDGMSSFLSKFNMAFLLRKLFSPLGPPVLRAAIA